MLLAKNPLSEPLSLPHLHWLKTNMSMLDQQVTLEYSDFGII